MLALAPTPASVPLQPPEFPGEAADARAGERTAPLPLPGLPAGKEKRESLGLSSSLSWLANWTWSMLLERPWCSWGSWLERCRGRCGGSKAESLRGALHTAPTVGQGVLRARHTGAAPRGTTWASHRLRA